MLHNLLEKIKEVIRSMFGYKDLKTAVGSSIISENMLDKIDEWDKMYSGKTTYEDVADGKYNNYAKSSRIEQGICKEFANIVMTEINVKVDDDEIDKKFQKAIRGLSEKLQTGLALGSFIVRPVAIDSDDVEYVRPYSASRGYGFLPIRFNSADRLEDVAFVSIKKIEKNSYYRRFEVHTIGPDGLTIQNICFHSSTLSDVGSRCELSDIDEWASLPESITYKINRPDFAYYRNPIGNNIDNSTCGVSIFDSAIDLIKKTDIQVSRLDWEFESGERALDVDATALQARPIIGADGQKRYQMPVLNKRLFRAVNVQGANGAELYKEWSPELREQNIINGINAYKRMIEFNVSLSYGDLSDVNEVEKTAEECKVAKQRKYNMVNSIEKNLKDCLDDLLFALLFYNRMTLSGAELSCTFGDSILTDEDKERANDKADVAMGVMSLVEYRMKWYNEDEKTAMEKINSINIADKIEE